MKKFFSIIWALAIFASLPAWATTTGDNQTFEGSVSVTKKPITFREITAPTGNPASNHGWLYLKDNGGASDLYFEDDAGTVTELTAAGSATAWDDIGDPDAAGTIAMTTYQQILTSTKTTDDMFLIRGLGNFGDVSVLRVESLTGNPTDGTVLEVVAHDANVDPLVVSTSGQAGVLKVNQDGTVSIVGNTDVTGSFSLTGSFYQTAIASAAAGNVALTVNASGNGQITIGDVSTGNVNIEPTIKANGNVDIGNAATDTLTITSIIDGDVTLDDGVANSPALIFKDATDETVSISKNDGGNMYLTTTAGEGVEVRVGNLRVGNGAPGTAAMDGEDFYVNGDSEFDGAVQLDGALTAAGAATLSGAVEFTGSTTTATLGAAEQVIIDAATTDHTGTEGALDINFDTATNAAEAINLRLHGVADAGGGSESWTGLEIDIDDDSDAANSLIGININSSDATGSSSVIGMNFGSVLETATNFNMGAAAKAIVIDAATVDNTVATGVVDMEFDSNTANAEAVNIKATHLTGGSGQTVSAMELELDSDSGNASDVLVGLIVNATDTTATGTVRGIYVKGAGLAAALQADTGYIRIGTGSTPDVTPGDDDLYVEGTGEFDGAVRFDGAITANSSITGDGGDALGGFLNTVTNDADGKTLTIAECGTIQTNAGAVGGGIWNLPEASTAIGCRYHFTTMAAQNFDINPDNADQIRGLTNAAGDAIRNATVGNSACLQAMDATNWAPCSDPYGTWTDVD